MDLLIMERRAIPPRPVDAGVITDMQKQAKFLVEEGVVVLQIQTEERISLREGTTTHNDLGSPPGDQVEGCEFLEDPYRISSTQDGDRTGQSDCLRSGCGRSQQNDGSRIEKFLPVMFPDPEDIKANPIGRLHLLEKIAKANNGINLGPSDRIRRRSNKTIDADLHPANPRDPTNSGKTKP